MSVALCPSPTWGRERTASVQSPHPWRQFVADRSSAMTGSSVATYLVQASQSDMRRIAAYENDWDGSGSSKPRSASVAHASARLIELCRFAVATSRWVRPHISASEEGDITFEWWNDDRKLTVYFGDNEMEVLRVWGTNMDTEMEHLHASQTGQLAQAWAWLYGN